MPEPELLSPEWWLKRLSDRLHRERKTMKLHDDYYRGDHPLIDVPEGLNERYLNAYLSLLRKSRANFMRLVVDAVRQRMRVQGFRLSGEDDPTADRESWLMWQANDLDGESALLFREALVKRRGYLSVWAGQRWPSIVVEDPMEVIHENVPGTRRQVAAALKLWRDDWTGQQRANVYLPDGIHKFTTTQTFTDTFPRWERLPDVNGQRQDFVANPVGVVPIVPVVNRPDTAGEGESEFADLTDIQDRINTMIFNRMLATWFTSFRQRWAAGIQIPEDPETGQPVEPFKAAMDRLWISEDKDASFGEFAATNLEPLLKGHERDIQDLAVISQTPRHYLFQSGQSPSGDAIESAESGFTEKIRDKHDTMGEDLERAKRIAWMFAGRADVPVDSEVVWEDPRRESPSARSDRIIKEFQAGIITWEVAAQKLGYTQTEIRRMRASRASDLIRQRAAELAELEEPEEVEPETVAA